MDYAKESLRLHSEWRGKLEVTPRAQVDSKEALSLAYTPGVAQPCLETEENACERCGVCPTLDFWTGLYAAVNEYVDRFTLADLVREELEKQGRASRPSTD